MQFWLHTQTPESRRLFFKDKFSPFVPIKKSIICLNNILRKNILIESQKTNNDRYEVKLDSAKKNDLVIVELSSVTGLIPTLSSNKYAININFNFNNKKGLPLKRTPIKFKIGVSSF